MVTSGCGPENGKKVMTDAFSNYSNYGRSVYNICRIRDSRA